jgi:membrane-anchored mycosin MYCP
MIIRRTRKVAALTGAVLISVMGPGLAPALAQDAQSGGIEAGIPPAYDGGVPAPAGNVPPSSNLDPAHPQLKLSQQCVVSFSKAQPKEFPKGQQWLRLDETHRYATGKGQTVAVIDTGVNAHNFLTLSPASANYLDVAGANKTDCDGHGTEVAGIIAAHTPKEDIGFQGMAPEAQIMSIRQSSSVIKQTVNGQDTGAGTPTTLAYAISWAAAHGASVINISLAACFLASESQTLRQDQKLLQAAIHAAAKQGVVIVAAAGNLQQQGQPCGDQNSNLDPNAPKWIESPAWFADDVLSVAAVAVDDDPKQGFQAGQPATFSVWGPWVSVAAPGTMIISLNPGTSDTLANQTFENNQLQDIQGTSFSAPYVAGLAALIKQKFPTLDAHQVMNRIKMTAQHPAAPGGRNNQVGYGMINPVAALTAVVPGEPGAPPIAKAEQIPSDLGDGAGTSLSPMMIALYGTGAGVALLIITLFVVHAVNTSRQRRSARPSRLRI